MSRTDEARTPKRRLNWLVQTILLTGLIVAGLTGWAFWRYGSVSAASEYFHGNRLIADTREKSFGEVNAGHNPIVRVRLTNLDDRPITVLGARTKCTCVVMGKLPMTIASQAEQPFAIEIRTARKDGPFEEVVRLFTDHPTQPELVLTIVGQVLGDGSKQETAKPGS